MRDFQGKDCGKGAAVTEVLAGCWWHGGVLEGAAAAALVAGTSALAGWSIGVALLLLAFCGTLLVYHIDRTPALSPEDRLTHPARWRWRHRHPRLAAGLAAGAAAGACATLPLLRTSTLWAGAVLAVPAAGYALPLFDEDERTSRLKDVGAAKPLAVAAAWAAASVVLPWFEAGRPSTHAGILLAGLVGYRFLFVLPNVLLADAADGPATAPARPRRLRHLAMGALAIAGGIGLTMRAALGAPSVAAVDAAGPLLFLAFVAAGPPPGRRLAHAADVALLWAGVTAVVAIGVGG